ncbi:hypothetical protein GCM10020001_039700 [Nonomuraea salmonea]
MTPLGRLGQPSDIAAMILALTKIPFVTGEVINVDGGINLFTHMDAPRDTAPPDSSRRGEKCGCFRATDRQRALDSIRNRLQPAVIREAYYLFRQFHWTGGWP